MHHTLANSASATDATLVDLAPIQDGIMTIANSHWYPQKPYDIVSAVVMGTNAQYAQVVTPKMRQLNPPWLPDLNAALVSVSNFAINDLRRTPISLNRLEEVQINYQQTSGGAQRGTVVMNWQLQQTPIPPGEMFVLRGTSTTAVVANVWSQLTVTWDTNLPAGEYSLIWAKVQSTNQQAFRFIIPGQYERPGFVGVPTLLSRQGDDIPVGGFGEWSRFFTTAFPIPEVLCNAADAAHVLFLYLIQTQKFNY